MSALINAAEWRMIMRDFADLVSAGEFNKFDYQAWKKLHETYDEDVLIDLWRVNRNWSDDYEFEYVISTNGRTYSFVDSDCSLGEFLYDNVLNDNTYLYKNSPKTGRVGWTDLIHNIEYTQHYDNICGGLITTSSDSGAKSAATTASATVASCSSAITGGSATVSAVYDDSLCSKITTGYLSIDDYNCGCAKGADGLEGIAKASYCDYDNAKGISGVIDKICTDYYIGDDLSTDYSYYTTTTTPSYDYNKYCSPIVGELITNKTNSISIRLDELATIEDVNHKMDEMKQTIADAMKDVMASTPLKNNNKEKEESKMKGFNFDFGPCDNSKVRMSMYGLAVKNAAGTWVSYNPKSKEVVDVDVLNFDGAKYMYKMPAALKDVAVGDVIVHNHKPMFVTEVTEDRKNLTVIDVYAGEEKHVIPTVNMFGFNFVTKVVSLFNTVSANAPSPDAPFGNMLPLLMLSEGGTDKIDPMMLMCMMGGTFDMSNPMMMYFLMKDGGDKDILPLMMMMNMNKPAAVAPAAPAAQ